MDKTQYTNLLLVENGIRLLVPLGNVKDKHLMECVECGHTWEATPLSKRQTFIKFGYKGCPICKQKRTDAQKLITRQQNKQRLTDKGLLYPDWWTGQRVWDKDNTPVKLPVTQIKCGHSFTSTVHNLLSRGVDCAICGIEERTTNINKSSKERSDEWRKTATPWKQYKTRVSNITKISYRQNKHIINPNNIKFGRAGEDGAYHLDHIVPVRYCFENNIPEELCGHPDNLQVLEWKENISCRDKLKGNIPEIFVDFVV